MTDSPINLVISLNTSFQFTVFSCQFIIFYVTVILHATCTLYLITNYSSLVTYHCVLFYLLAPDSWLLIFFTRYDSPDTRYLLSISLSLTARNNTLYAKRYTLVIFLFRYTFFSFYFYFTLFGLFPFLTLYFSIDYYKSNILLRIAPALFFISIFKVNFYS